MNAIEARELIESQKLVTLKKWIYLEIKRRIIEHTYPLKPDVKSLDDNLIWVDQRVRIGDGSSFFPPVYIIGDTVIGKNAVIETGAIIRDAIMEDECSIGPYAEIIGSKIGSKTIISHARIEDSTIGEECIIGYTAQIKRAQIGSRINALHHCYLGDTIVGNDVNISAGLITANYDGVKKNKTIIGDGAFIGTNVNIIAPLHIGREAMVAAGSTITKNIKPYTLVLARPEKQYESQSRYHRKTPRGFELTIKIPKELLEKLRSVCRFTDEERYQFLTTPNQQLNGNMPIDFLFGENAEQVFKQCLALALTCCNNTPH